MGMTGGLVRASLEEIVRLREHPSELPEFLDGGVWAPPIREVRPKGLRGWLLRLTPLRIYEGDPEAVPPPDADNGPIRPKVDLDKAWEPLHLLLTGTEFEGDEPACYLAKGGEELVEEVGEVDESVYSSIRVLMPEQVASFDRHLSALTVEELRRRYDAAWSKRRGRRPVDEAENTKTFGYLVEAFEELRTFVRETAATGAGLIAYLA